MVELVHTNKLELPKIVVPIFGPGANGGAGPFLGTGFFVGEECHLATANHILKGLGSDFLVVLSDTPDRRYKASLARHDEGSDLALLKVEGYRPDVWFSLGRDGDIQQHRLVFCNEFGSTRVLGRQTQLSMATRVGNITRIFRHLEPYGRAGEEMLELSFPALRGASGAPVLSAENGLVLGVIIANVDYHLLPAQIETIHGENGSVSEETRFMLPQALAVHYKHLQSLLRQPDDQPGGA